MIVKAIIVTVHGNVSVWRAEMKVAAIKLEFLKSGAKFSAAIENSGQMIHSEHDSHFSVGLSPED